MPKNPFTLTSNGDHSHMTTFQMSRLTVDGTSPLCPSQNGYHGSSSFSTNTTGAHTHTILGGDSETRPRNVALHYIIRAK
jgi:hypothetical protein